MLRYAAIHGRQETESSGKKTVCLRAAFATLAYHPEGDLLDRLAHHAASIVRTFRPQATSNSLWAFAKLAYVPCQLFLTTSASQARTLNPECKRLAGLSKQGLLVVHVSCFGCLVLADMACQLQGVAEMLKFLATGQRPVSG